VQATGSRALFIHCEINPYRNKRWAVEQLERNAYRSYLQIRGRFEERLASTGVPNLVSGGGSNQIGKARMDLAAATVGEAAQAIAVFVKHSTRAIDGLVKEIVER
jgi:hypothetical protein